MTIPENSLLGNVKHNTASIFDRAKSWATAKYEALINHVEVLEDDQNPQARQELERLADEHSIPHDYETTKEELAERIKDHFNHKQFLTD